MKLNNKIKVGDMAYWPHSPKSYCLDIVTGINRNFVYFKNINIGDRTYFLDKNRNGYSDHIINPPKILLKFLGYKNEV